MTGPYEAYSIGTDSILLQVYFLSLLPLIASPSHMSIIAPIFLQMPLIDFLTTLPGLKKYHIYMHNDNLCTTIIQHKMCIQNRENPRKLF